MDLAGVRRLVNMAAAHGLRLKGVLTKSMLLNLNTIHTETLGCVVKNSWKMVFFIETA